MVGELEVVGVYLTASLLLFFDVTSMQRFQTAKLNAHPTIRDPDTIFSTGPSSTNFY